MASASVDVPYLAASLAIAEPSIQNLLDSPTTELIATFLQQVGNKIHEFDELRSEKLRQDVELENAIRSGETRTQSLKASLSKSQKDVENLRNQIITEESARNELQSELQALKSSSTTSVSEVEILQARISTLEASNRDALALVDAKSTAHDSLAEELSAQHQKTLTLRREVSELEVKVQSLENAKSSTRFREQSLQQELELLKKNNDWFEGELKAKAAEYSTYRKDKSAQISELSRANEDATQTIGSVRRTETALRKQLSDLNTKAEESYAKIQQLQEVAAKANESFQVELDGARRLADLQKQSADTARSRLQDVQNLYDELRENAADEIGQIQAEVDSERAEKDSAEARVLQLEAQIERLENERHTYRPAMSVPGTPREGMNGSSTPMGVGSPGSHFSQTPRAKGGLSFTQLYSQHAEMKSALDAEKRRNAQLRSSIDDMLQDLETKQPEVEELRINHDRLQAMSEELSSHLDEATQARDLARKEVKLLSGRVEGLVREKDLHQQSLRDLSAQVTVLVVEVQSRSEGFEPLHGSQWADMIKLAKNGFDERQLEGMTETAQYITKRLTTFKTVKELQEQNSNLLRITRELGEQMEGEQAKAERNQHEQDRKELDSLRDRVERHRDEMKAMITQTESYVRERDMFRRMLANRSQIPEGADASAMFGQSIDGRSVPATPTPGQSTPRPPADATQQIADIVQSLKETQQQFDQYRQETATDQTALRHQIDQVSREKNELQSEIARSGSQLTLSHERYELLRSNYDMLQNESAELQRRSQSLSENAAKQDLRTQQVAEELVEARALVDGMRNETANLKAEKDLWKGIEGRLTEDNRQLMDDRSRLNKMISDLQNLQNERELSESETRRRLQTRSDALESELQTVRRKLEEEVEDRKKATLRREYDSDQSRTRIDDLVKSLGNAKEELAAAKNERDNLQARVSELKIELKNAEGRAEALQPIRTARPESTSTTAVAAADEDQTLSREQELGVEVADLKRDLELARNELEAAKAHVEQYKAISQSSEEELQSLNETNDQYRAEMDSIIAEKDAKIATLNQRCEDTWAELSTTNNELINIRAQQDDAKFKFEDQKAIFEAEIARLTSESEKNADNARLHQQDVRAQADIAQLAQQNYENELVKHAEAASNLQSLRSEYNQIKTEVTESKANAEAAKFTLLQNEETWEETKLRYETELTELRTRREDVNNQNRLLHQQLENVGAQITSLKQNRAEAEAAEDETTTSLGSGMEGLQEVIQYLRREKEIVDVQLELSVQEGRRLRQQLDNTSSQLDQAREKLTQERQSSINKDQSANSHSKLMETINELNVFRASSVTLRNEARQLQTQLGEKTKQAEDLITQIQPLNAKIRELEEELETKEGQKKLLEEDRDRWHQRTQNILQKSNRIDPAEVENLNSQITDLTAERDRLSAEVQPLKEQIEGIPQQIEASKEELNKEWVGRRDKMIEQFKTRSKALSEKIKEKDAEKEVVVQEKQAVADQLEGARKELEQVKSQLQITQSALQEASSQAQNLAPAAADVEMDDGQIQETNTDTTSRLADLEAREKAANELAAVESNKVAELEASATALHSQIEALEAQVNELQQSLEAVNATASQPGNADNTTANVGSSEELSALRQELAIAQQQAEELRASAAVAASVGTTNADGDTSVADQVSQQVEKIRSELETSHNERVAQAEAQYNQRADKMKEQLSKRLSEGKQAYRQQVQQEHEEAMQQLRSQHEAELEALKTQHSQDMAGNGSAPAQAEQTQAVKDETSQPNGETAKPAVKWDPTAEEVRQLLGTNAAMKAIVANNVRTKLQQETTKVKDEHEKVLQQKLEEAQKKSEKDVENARIMESKRTGVKLSMAETKARNAAAKIEVVEKAATDTPQRAVGEVWSIAKDARPTAPVPSQTAQPPATQQASSVQQTPAQTVQQTPAPQTRSVPPVQATPSQPQATAAQATPNPFGQPTQPQLLRPPQRRPSQSGLPRPPSAQGQNAGQAAPNALGNPPQTATGIPTSIPAATTAAGARRPSIPRPAMPGQTGRGGQQSGLPRAGGAAGAGRGRGRGGAAAGTAPATAGGRGGASMNPSARQFVPGGGGANKRARESSVSDAGTGVKKPRGGGSVGGAAS